MAKILIVGASKGMGLETVKQALSVGHSVRALARSADTIPINNYNLEKVSGDARDRPTVARALDAVDAAILTLGVTGPELMLKPITLFSEATRVIVEAMDEVSVGRLICVTGLGAGDSRGKGGILYNAVFFPLFLKRAYDDKDVQEWIIRASKLDWVIARPGLLTRGPRTGCYQILTRPEDWRTGSISRADVADFLVKQIDDDTYIGQTPLLIT